LHELALLPLADDAATHLLADVPERQRQDCWWLVLRDRTLVPGDAGGGVALLAEVRVTQRLGRFLRLVGEPAIDALDKLVSSHRGASAGSSPTVPHHVATRDDLVIAAARGY
jgi:hypothetical protein